MSIYKIQKAMLVKNYPKVRRLITKKPTPEDLQILCELAIKAEDDRLIEILLDHKLVDEKRLFTKFAIIANSRGNLAVRDRILNELKPNIQFIDD